MGRDLIRTHKIQLQPTVAQELNLRQAAGVARHAYNWTLAWWQEEYKKYKNGERDKAPNGAEASRVLNSIKRDEFPFYLEVTKCAPNHATKHVQKAFTAFFKGTSKYPQFKSKKKSRVSFTVDCPPTLKLKSKRVLIGKCGWVKMCEELRFEGKILNSTVFKHAGKWYISIPVELSEPIVRVVTKKAVGVDVGVREYVTSEGQRSAVPRSTRKYEKQLKRAQQNLSRKHPGSKNREKAKLRVQKKHKKISDVREDWLHKLTTGLSQHEYVALEDLNVSGMVKNRRLAKSISDASFYTFRYMLEYKTDVKLVSRWFPSSKLCSVCGVVRTKLPLNVRTWMCECGTTHDRDLNAAINILNETQITDESAVTACGEFLTSAKESGTLDSEVSNLCEAGTTVKKEE